MLDWSASDILSVLAYLLPGFLAAWAYYGLTSFPKPSQFERVVQAFIFTILVQVILFGVESIYRGVQGHVLLLPSISSHGRVTLSVLVAFLMGALFARFSNNDKFHAVMRRLKFTQETSYPSEWFSAFANHKTYVVLHLAGERRLYGWPAEWPSDPKEGHFAIAEAEWLTDGESVPLPSVERVLVPVSEIEIVEFMDLKEKEKANE